MTDRMSRAFRRAADALCAAYALYSPLPGGILPRFPAPRRRGGQTTIEYLLMLAVVAGMAAMMAVLFHRRILGGLFTLVGMIIGAGQPK